MGGELMDVNDLSNRFTYHPPTLEQAVVYPEIRAAGLLLATLMNNYCPDSRELSLAITHVEEAVMWANASIARSGEAQ